ncbi:hypothetical protein PUN28_004129 [Cardiocondyla obscurior]|uniref:Uncharacterized protein n=1 Tax=Cardiocondyla obscurior TaxID=286306 RepID=A0AAW2GPQ2_9HYME
MRYRGIPEVPGVDHWTRPTLVCWTRIRSGVRRHSHSLRALVLGSLRTYGGFRIGPRYTCRSATITSHRYRLTAPFAEFRSLARILHAEYRSAANSRQVIEINVISRSRITLSNFYPRSNRNANPSRM